MIICDIISWIWRYLIYCQVFGCYRGWRIRVFDFTLGTLASRTTFLWWSTSFARILIQPKFSTRMALVCTLDPFLAFWAFCWKRLLLQIEFHAPKVSYERTEIRQTWAKFMFTPMYFHSFFGTSGGVVAKGGTATSASTRTRLRAFIIETWSKTSLFPIYQL